MLGPSDSPVQRYSPKNIIVLGLPSAKKAIKDVIIIDSPGVFKRVVL